MSGHGPEERIGVGSDGADGAAAASEAAQVQDVRRSLADQLAQRTKDLVRSDAMRRAVTLSAT